MWHAYEIYMYMRLIWVWDWLQRRFSIHSTVVLKHKPVPELPLGLIETQIVQQILLGQLGIHMQKNGVGSLRHIISKKFTQGIKDLNIWAMIIKKILRINHRYTYLWPWVLGRTPKVQIIKEINKLSNFKNKNIYVPKNPINKVKRQSIEWEKHLQM